MDPTRLFNCCTTHVAPDWSQFVQLELAGCRNESDKPEETSTVELQPVSRSEFFTIYGRFPQPDGTCEAITDIDDAGQALAVAAEPAALSSLSCIVHPSLLEDRQSALQFSYSPWRHGGWSTNVFYPSGACGCVSRNYDDGKWRIVCDPRPFEERPTFKTRDAAARAEWELAQAQWENVRAATGAMFQALTRIAPVLATMPEHKFLSDLAASALAKTDPAT